MEHRNRSFERAWRGGTGKCVWKGRIQTTPLVRQACCSKYLSDLPSSLPPLIHRACAAFKRPPFRIEEEGWGEFDMEIILTPIEKGGEHSLPHDLNFQSERYEARHNVVSFHGMLNGTERILLNRVPFFAARPSRIQSLDFWPCWKNRGQPSATRMVRNQNEGMNPQRRRSGLTKGYDEVIRRSIIALFDRAR